MNGSMLLVALFDIGSETTINAAGTYEVTATTTDGTQCSRTLEIQVNESNIAEINENHVTVVDDLNDGNGAFSVTIDTADLGVGDYEYALVGENDFRHIAIKMILFLKI